MRCTGKKACAFLILILVVLSGCEGTARDSSAKSELKEDPDYELSYPLTLKVGYSTDEEDPRGEAFQRMKKIVEEKTNRQILLEIHPSGQLGSDAQLIAKMITGEVDLTVSSAGNYALYAPRIGISALPFLFNDFQSAWEFIDSEQMQEICAELEPYNMHVLTFFDNGFRCVTTSSTPVRSVSDMEGLDIRTPDNQIVMETMSELGARPRSYPFAQLKEALANGEFDAQENPIPVIYNNDLYEVQKFLSITNHSYDAMPVTIRQDVWVQLPEEYREVLLRAAKEAQGLNRTLVAEQTERYVSRLESKGMTVLYPEIGEFIDATRGVMEVFANVYGEKLLGTIMRDVANAGTR